MGVETNILWNNTEYIDQNEGQEFNINKTIDNIITDPDLPITTDNKKQISLIISNTLNQTNEINLKTFEKQFKNMFLSLYDEDESFPNEILDKIEKKEIWNLRELLKKENINYQKDNSKTISKEISEEILKDTNKKIEWINNIEKDLLKYNINKQPTDTIFAQEVKKVLTITYTDENLSDDQINEKVQTILKAQIIAQQIADKMANPPAGYTPSVEEIKFLENINKLNTSLWLDEIRNEKTGKPPHIKSLESINEDSNNNFSAEFKETNTDIKNDYIEDKNVTVMNKESLKETIGNSMNDSIIEKIGIIKEPEIKEEISSILNQVSSKNPNAKLNPKDIMDNYFDNISFNNDWDLQIKESDSSNLNTLFGKISDLNIYKFKVLSERKSY